MIAASLKNLRDHKIYHHHLRDTLWMFRQLPVLLKVLREHVPRDVLPSPQSMTNVAQNSSSFWLLPSASEKMAAFNIGLTCITKDAERSMVSHLPQIRKASLAQVTRVLKTNI